MELTEPLYIDENNGLIETAQKFGWKGTGTKENPIVISNMYFNLVNRPGEHCMALYNTDLYLIISGCKFKNKCSDEPENYGSGISMSGVKNVTITNNKFYGTYADNIFIYGMCEDIMIYNNLFKNRLGRAYISENISIRGSKRVYIINNTFDGGNNGINLLSALDSQVIYNTIKNMGYGICVDGSHRNVILGNTIKWTKRLQASAVLGTGIYIHDSTLNTIIKNFINDVNNLCILIAGTDSKFNYVYDNIFISNRQHYIFYSMMTYHGEIWSKDNILMKNIGLNIGLYESKYRKPRTELNITRRNLFI